MTKDNLIATKTFDFSLQIIQLYTFLIDNKEFVLSKQILRSGTSIGANVEEAVGAISKKEFTAKMGISLKEARETRYWLKLLSKSQLIKKDYNNELKAIEEIINILTAIVKTSQNNIKNL
ncbi:MAG: four helix bundle protein [Bacteroidia bacterium]|nr:four helix bundle protein [Bacteroidia bacterium]